MPPFAPGWINGSSANRSRRAWRSRCRVAGEFEDSALLKTFGASGMGVFPAADCVHDQLVARYGVRRVGTCEGVEEQFVAIGTEKKVQHPCVLRLLAARRG